MRPVARPIFRFKRPMTDPGVWRDLATINVHIPPGRATGTMVQGPRTSMGWTVFYEPLDPYSRGRGARFLNGLGADVAKAAANWPESCAGRVLCHRIFE